MSLYAHTSLVLRVDLSPEAEAYLSRRAAAASLTLGNYVSREFLKQINGAFREFGNPGAEANIYPAEGGV
jgi:hypothetical protein